VAWASAPWQRSAYSAEIHYLKHAVVGQEWPAQTTLEAYLASIRDVILDSRSGLFTSRYFGEWQLGIVGRSSAPESAGPPTFILVEYRLSIGHWVTAYRAEAGLRALDDPNREELRWLRRPR
jgi:hypothetical protein